MHLAEGVLSGPVLIGSAALSAIGVTVGLRRLDDARLPAAALMGAAFLVCSAIHVPVGVGSVHLVLNGLAGVLLGRAIFPVFGVALLLQALLFSFGGLTVLGANLLILAVPGLLVHRLLRGRLAGWTGDPRHVARWPGRWLAAGAVCGIAGIGGAALLACAALALSGGSSFKHLITLFVVAHLPVFVIDSLVSGLVLSILRRLLPDAFR